MDCVEIREARELLRKIYNEYIKELHSIMSKIDKNLEMLENESMDR